MTEPLYREDAYLDRCEAVVTAVTGAGVVLDRTVFYPAGGGQPGDTGRLVWEGGEAAVADAVGHEGGVAHPLAAEAAPPPVGARVEAVLDWPRRFAHMRCHTALHLLSVVVPLPVTGGQIAAGRGRLDFDMPEAPEDKALLEERLLALVEAGRPVSAEWITDAELEAEPGLVKTMSVRPPTGQGRVRLVRVGAPGDTVDLQPCGGTHVRSTAEIGRVSLGKIEKKGRRNRRVSIVLDP